MVGANSRAGTVAKAKALSLLNGLNPTSRPHKCIQHYTQYFSNTTYIAWSFRWKCKIWPPRIKFPISIIAFVSLWVDSYPSFCLWWLTRIIFKFFCLWWLTNRKLTNSPTFGDSLMRLERNSSLATTPSLTQLPLAPSMLLDSSSSARFLCLAHLCKNWLFRTLWFHV